MITLTGGGRFTQTIKFTNQNISKGIPMTSNTPHRSIEDRSADRRAEDRAARLDRWEAEHAHLDSEAYMMALETRFIMD